MMEIRIMNFKDYVVFDDKTLDDLFKDIYNNSTKRRGTISELVTKLNGLTGTVTDATVLVPLIKEYLEIAVRNDEQLIKLASVIQKAIQSNTKTRTDSSDDDGGISREELRIILGDDPDKYIKELVEGEKSLDDQVKKAEGDSNAISDR